MRVFRLASSLLLVALPSVAIAADWQLVTNGADGTAIYFDVSSATTSQAVTSFWVKFDFQTKRITVADQARKEKLAELAGAGIYANGNTVSMVATEDVTPDHDIERWQVRCAGRTFSVAQSFTYNALGHVVRSLEGNGNFTVALPDSVAEDIVTRVCK